MRACVRAWVGACVRVRAACACVHACVRVGVVGWACACVRVSLVCVWEVGAGGVVCVCECVCVLGLMPAAARM